MVSISGRSPDREWQYQYYRPDRLPGLYDRDYGRPGPYGLGVAVTTQSYHLSKPDTWTRLISRPKTAISAARRRARPISAHFADHGYTIAGFGCISAASFRFSVSIGLYVTGVLLLVFELKVSE